MPLTLTMHPGSDGDALTLTWPGSGPGSGPGQDNAPRHALIDLGRSADYRALRPWLAATGTLALFVATHIDADHIEGAMPLVAEAVPPFAPADVWFNGRRHLRAAWQRLHGLQAMGILQAEKLSDGITCFGWPWNVAFGGGPVSTDSLDAACTLDVQGLRVTLLSPSDVELANLSKDWEAALAKANLRLDDPDEAPPTPAGLERMAALNVRALAAAPMRPDSATPNGSSIAFLAEHGGKRVLMGADAHPGVLERALAARGYGPQNRLAIDVFKLSHHGSRANTSPALLEMIECTRFAFSTDGSRHHFPDPETVARILVADPDRDKVLYFNYRQPQALMWDDARLQSEWHYSVVMPDEGTTGLVIDA